MVGEAGIDVAGPKAGSFKRRDNHVRLIVPGGLAPLKEDNSPMLFYSY